jgi:hypothetical protein
MESSHEAVRRRNLSRDEAGGREEGAAVSRGHSAQGGSLPSGAGRDAERLRPAWRPGVTAAAGAVLGLGGFASASLGGAAAAGHPAIPGLGVRALADDDVGIWVDNAGGNAGSHQAENRRLACAPIDVWGADLEHGSGTYTVVSEEPTDHDQKVVQGDWHYAEKQGGKQVLSSVAGADLVRAAVAQRATPHEEDGFHFAIRIERGGKEHERHFWVAACPAPAPAPPAPAAVPPRSGVSAAAAVPRTGADPHDL